MKKVYKLILCLLVFSFCLPFININKRYFAEYLSSAKSMVVIDAIGNRKLCSKNENEKLPIASTTKIVTALTVLNNCDDINQEVLVDDRAIGVEGTSIYLKKGEILSVKELLYGMMLPSGNDAATALAYFISKDIGVFCSLMNETAIKCGALNSSFSNPHGLDDNMHYSTAYDLALITAKALENKTFLEIVTTKNIKIKGATQGTYRYLKNKNKLLNTLDGCIGVKTGFTNKAGRCLVSACERNGFKTVCVTLNCGPMFEESSNLINTVYKNYSVYNILDKYSICRNVLVNDGKNAFVKTYTKKGFKYVLKEEEFNRLEYNYILPNFLNAPIKKDEIVGKIEIYLDNHLLFSEKIYTIDSVKKIGVWNNIKDIVSSW